MFQRLSRIRANNWQATNETFHFHVRSEDYQPEEYYWILMVALATKRMGARVLRPIVPERPDV